MSAQVYGEPDTDDAIIRAYTERIAQMSDDALRMELETVRTSAAWHERDRLALDYVNAILDEMWRRKIKPNGDVA